MSSRIGEILCLHCGQFRLRPFRIEKPFLVRVNGYIVSIQLGVGLECTICKKKFTIRPVVDVVKEDTTSLT